MLFLMSLLILCAGAEPPHKDEAPAKNEFPKPIEFKTLRVRLSTGGLCPGGHYAIRSLQDWATMCDEQHNQTNRSREAGGKPVITPPQLDVDFDTTMVVAAIYGSCSSGGYSIEVHDVVEMDNHIRVVVRRRTPPPMSVRTMAFTCPIHVVTLPRSDKPVCFELWKIEHPERLRQTGPVDPNIYKEFEYSADSKAQVNIALISMRDVPLDDRPAHSRAIQDGVLAIFEPGEFEVTHRLKSVTGMMGRISSSGLEKLIEHPDFVAVNLGGQFSLPDKFVLQRGCH